MSSWIEVGTKILVLNDWLLYDSPVFGESFRFSPGNLQHYQFFKTYAVVRLSWLDGDDQIFTESKRVYPRPEKLVLDFPIPQDIKDTAGGLVRYIWVKKRIYYRWRGRSNEPPWTLKIEDYV